MCGPGINFAKLGHEQHGMAYSVLMSGKLVTQLHTNNITVWCQKLGYSACYLAGILLETCALKNIQVLHRGVR